MTNREYEDVLNEEQIMLDETLDELERRQQRESAKLAAVVHSALEQEIRRVIHA